MYGMGKKDSPCAQTCHTITGGEKSCSETGRRRAPLVGDGHPEGAFVPLSPLIVSDTTRAMASPRSALGCGSN